MTQDLVPWMKHNLATTGHEQIWLIGSPSPARSAVSSAEASRRVHAGGFLGFPGRYVLLQPG